MPLGELRNRRSCQCGLCLAPVHRFDGGEGLVSLVYAILSLWTHTEEVWSVFTVES